MVTYGRTCPSDGFFLPVYSVDTEEEAQILIATACPLAKDGSGYYAPELADSQDLETLSAFGDRLHGIQQQLEARR